MLIEPQLGGPFLQRLLARQRWHPGRLERCAGGRAPAGVAGDASRRLRRPTWRPAGARGTMAGPVRIDAIQIQSQGRIPPSFIRKYLGVNEGDHYDGVTLNREMAQLSTSGRFRKRDAGARHRGWRAMC
ncbi:hypothetical protein ACU4GD_40610 [Cupriavidus basilensis]